MTSTVGGEGPLRSPSGGDSVSSVRTGVDLYWLPLGAGGHFVRLNGRVYESVAARLARRPICDLYHSALEVRVPEGRFVIESAPIRSSDGAPRGVAGEGAVGSRWAGRLRIFRYELRFWHEGVIPDVAEAIESPRHLTDDPERARQLLALASSVPTPMWGRDELHAGELWNSNSVIAWLIARSGLDADAIQPPQGGRAPGWNAGLVVARRQELKAPPEPPRPNAVDAARAFAVMIGGSLAVDMAAIASLAALVKAISRRKRPPSLALVGTAATVFYVRVLRPRMLNWGATAEEAGMELPGDELAPGEPIASTHAVTIDAPVAEVWPWLAQLGQDRGGFYSYEWLENCAGCRMRNADRIHPEWQHRDLGEAVKLHWSVGLPVTLFEPNRVLALKEWGAFVVEPVDDEHTRLLARGHRKRGLAGVYVLLLIEIPHFFMQRKMLLGIKQRAERIRLQAR